MTTSRSLNTGRLIALLAVFTAVPLILLVVLPLQMATTALGNEATNRVSDTAAVSANAISLQMQSLSGLAQSFSSRPELEAKTNIPTDSANNPARQILSQLVASNSNVRSAFLLDADGKFVLSQPTAAGAGAGTDLSYRAYYKGALDTSDVYVGPAVIAVSSAHPKIVTVSKAIRGDANGTGTEPVVGVLVVSVDVSTTFQAYVDAFAQTSGVATSIVDQTGVVVATPGLKVSVPTTIDPRLEDARKGGSAAVTEKQQGKKMITAYSPVAGTSWVLTTSVPEKSAFAPIAQFRGRVISIALILGTVIFVALGLLVRSIRRTENSDKEVRVSEERTRKVIDTVSQVFIELDSEFKVTDWNTQAEVLLGWTREEILGKSPIAMIIPIERRDSTIRELNELISEPVEASPRMTRNGNFITKNEESIPVEVSIWMTEVAGQRRLNVFAQDIGDRVRLEREQELVVKRQRRLVEELRTADKAKNDFISTISHELRTPLTSIVGYLEMLNDGYGGELSANQTSMLDVIDRNSRRLLSLIEDVLTLSRIESGVFKGRAVAVEVSNLVAGAVQTFVPQARTKSIEMVTDVPKEVGWIRGDQSQLERVLLNVISNAVKFTPENGKVTIHGYRHEDRMTVSIHDTGIGIPLQEQHRLFSRFFRASTAQEQAIQGTGLGLTIVKSVVERHGGTINIQSSEGNGTTVILEFPAVDAEANALA